jgi:Mg2+ and Co2+ transporter CorA
MDVELGAMSRRLNEVLRRFTVVTVVGLPLLFLAALLGMNVPIPGTQVTPPYIFFWVLVGVFIFTIALSLAIMRAVHWL